MSPAVGALIVPQARHLHQPHPLGPLQRPASRPSGRGHVTVGILPCTDPGAAALPPVPSWFPWLTLPPPLTAPSTRLCPLQHCVVTGQDPGQQARPAPLAPLACAAAGLTLGAATPGPSARIFSGLRQCGAPQAIALTLAKGKSFRFQTANSREQRTWRDGTGPGSAQVHPAHGPARSPAGVRDCQALVVPRPSRAKGELCPKLL